MGRLHGLGSKAHVLQHLRVGVGVFQCLPLELDGGQGAIDLGQLFLVPLLSFQSLQGGWEQKKKRMKHQDEGSFANYYLLLGIIHPQWSFAFIT